jgi:hypothetical protein
VSPPCRMGYHGGMRDFPIAVLLDNSICTMWLERHLHPRGLVCLHSVLLVDRFQQHRHRLLDDLLLDREFADWALTPGLRLDPDALDGRGMVGSAAQTLMQVPPVLGKVFGVRRRCHPVNPWDTRLTRVAVRLPHKVFIDQEGQGREYPRRIAGRLCRNALQCWCDGW